MGKIKRGKEEKEKLDSADGTADTIKSVSEEIIKISPEETDSLDLPEGAKTVLKAVSKFVSVLTNSKFKKADKIKDLLKISAKFAPKT